MSETFLSPETGAEEAALTKAELVDMLFEQMGMNKRDAKQIGRAHV